jgi:hypothetical protein
MSVLLNLPLVFLLAIIILFGFVCIVFGYTALRSSTCSDRILREKVFFVITGITLLSAGIMFCLSAWYFWAQQSL